MDYLSLLQSSSRKQPTGSTHDATTGRVTVGQHTQYQSRTLPRTIKAEWDDSSASPEIDRHITNALVRQIDDELTALRRADGKRMIIDESLLGSKYHEGDDWVIVSPAMAKLIDKMDRRSGLKPSFGPGKTSLNAFAQSYEAYDDAKIGTVIRDMAQLPGMTLSATAQPHELPVHQHSRSNDGDVFDIHGAQIEQYPNGNWLASVWIRKGGGEWTLHKSHAVPNPQSARVMMDISMDSVAPGLSRSIRWETFGYVKR